MLSSNSFYHFILMWYHILIFLKLYRRFIAIKYIFLSLMCVLWSVNRIWTFVIIALFVVWDINTVNQVVGVSFCFTFIFDVFLSSISVSRSYTEFVVVFCVTWRSKFIITLSIANYWYVCCFIVLTYMQHYWLLQWYGWDVVMHYVRRWRRLLTGVRN